MLIDPDAWKEILPEAYEPPEVLGPVTCSCVTVSVFVSVAAIVMFPVPLSFKTETLLPPIILT